MPDVPSQAAGWTSLFTESEWFDRGWTLQELIAPRLVEFYSRDWSAIGTKIQRCDELVTRTHIDRDVLLNPALVESNSAANRMSWAAHRQVTREEDQAYCLLGMQVVSEEEQRVVSRGVIYRLLQSSKCFSCTFTI